LPQYENRRGNSSNNIQKRESESSGKHIVHGKQYEYQELSYFEGIWIDDTQFNILRILRGQHPDSTSINSLIERMLDKASNASRIVEKLREKNLVVRTTNSIDRRSVDVKITEFGLNLLAKIDVVDEEFHFGTDSLSQAEVMMLNHLLDKGRKSIINF